MPSVMVFVTFLSFAYLAKVKKSTSDMGVPTEWESNRRMVATAV
jgi:hypothetical protein